MGFRRQVPYVAMCIALATKVLWALASGRQAGSRLVCQGPMWHADTRTAQGSSKREPCSCSLDNLVVKAPHFMLPAGTLARLCTATSGQPGVECALEDSEANRGRCITGLAGASPCKGPNEAAAQYLPLTWCAGKHGRHLRLQHLDQSLLVAGFHAAEDRHALQRQQLLLRRQLVELQACATAHTRCNPAQQTLCAQLPAAGTGRAEGTALGIQAFKSPHAAVLACRPLS